MIAAGKAASSHQAALMGAHRKCRFQSYVAKGEAESKTNISGFGFFWEMARWHPPHRATALQERVDRALPSCRDHWIVSCELDDQTGAGPRGGSGGGPPGGGVYDTLPSRPGELWFLSACAHAALAGRADQAGSGVSAAEAASEAETAVARLHQAVAVGYRNADALDPLPDLEDFRLLMMVLPIPAEPFAQDTVADR